MKKISGVLLLLILIPTFIHAGYNFRDDFNGGAINTSVWFNDCWVGKDGWLDYQAKNTAYDAVAGGALSIYGTPWSDQDGQGMWATESCFITNQIFSASLYQPVGMAAQCVAFRLDPGELAFKGRCSYSMWMIRDLFPNMAAYSNPGDAFNAIATFDHTIGGNDAFMRSYYGAFTGFLRDFNLAAAERPDGRTVDITSIEGFADMGNSVNSTLDIVFQMTHDGDKVQFFINPDPEDANGFPNEFLKVYEEQVLWSDYIRFGLGIENRGGNAGYSRGDWGWAMIRSAVDTAGATIDPVTIDKSTNLDDRKTFTYTITPTISASNAGINYIQLTKPDEFESTWAEVNLTNEILVVSDYNDDGTLETNISRSKYTNLSFNEAMVSTNGNVLYIGLGTQIKSDTDNKTIKIIFSVACTNQYSGSREFITTVDARLFDDMTDKSNYATCGPQRSINNGNDVSLSKGPARGYSSITPNVINQGTSSYTFTYYISTKGVSNADSIGEMVIHIPNSNFHVNPNSFDSYSMGNDEPSRISVVGTNIILDYSGIEIDAPGGVDTITFECTNVPAGTWMWTSQVDASSVGPSSYFTLTNSINPSQEVIVYGEEPDLTAYVQTKYADPNTIDSTSQSNRLTYVIYNAGSDSGNYIEVVRIMIPDVFTKITNLKSSNLGLNPATAKLTNINSTNWLEIDYGATSSSISINNYDYIWFDVWDNVSSFNETNISMPSYVNNSNGQGFFLSRVQGSWDIYIRPPVAQGLGYLLQPLPESNPYIYTTDVTNNYQFYLYNIGAISNFIHYAEIIIPDGTQVVTNSIVSSEIIMPALYLKVTNYSGTNGILFKYYKDGTERFWDGQPESSDTISFKLVDSFTSVTQFNIQARINNSTNMDPFKWEFVGVTPAKSQQVSVIFPPPIGQAAATPDQIFTTDITNSYTLTVNNQGDSGNDINNLIITLPTIFTQILSINSSFIQDSTNEDYLPSASSITLNYINDSAGVLSAQSNDTITLKLANNQILPGTFNWQIQANNQSGWGNITNSSPGTLSLEVKIPDPDSSSYLEPSLLLSTRTRSTLSYYIINEGIGNNYITKARIQIPSCFTNIVSANSPWPSSTEIIDNNISVVTLDYTSVPLTTGSTDKVTLVIEDNITNQLSYNFSSLVGNASKWTNTYTASGKTNTMFFNNPSYSYIYANTPGENSIESSSITNDFEYYIGSGTFGGREVDTARISVPAAIFTQFIDILSDEIFDDSTNVKLTNNYIYIYYFRDGAALQFSDGEDKVTFKAIDNISKVSNLTSWPFEVDYANDGQGFLPGITQSGESQDIIINFSKATGCSYVSPTELYTTKNINTVTYTVLNRGRNSNYIEKVRLYYPTAGLDTSVGNVLSSIITNDNVNIDVNDALGRIIIDYTTESTNLPADISDTVTITFIDTISANNTKCTVVGQIDNGDGNLYVNTDSDCGSKVINFINPSEAYIIPNNYSTSSNIDVFTVTNTYTYKLLGKGNPVERAVIIVPPVISNIISVDSSYISSDATNIKISGTSSITLDYNSDGNGDLEIASIDTITIVAVDNLVTGYSNVVWDCYVNDGSGYVDTLTSSGQSKGLGYYMSSALANGQIAPNEIYSTATLSKFTIKITNKGDGSNDIPRALISIPSIFTQIVWITNTHMASTTNIRLNNSSEITLSYELDSNGVLEPGEEDIITINVLDDTTNSGVSYSWNTYVDNNDGNGYVAASEVFLNALKTKVAGPPEIDLTPNNIFTTTLTNSFTFTVDNSGFGGTTSLYKVRINIPDVFTNFGLSGSAATNVITNKPANYLILEYAEIPNGGGDSFTIKTWDALETGNSNVTFSVLADKNDGNGYLPTKVSGSADVSFIMPIASAKGKLIPNDVSTTIISNIYTYTVENIGSGYNDLFIAEIIMPGTFTNISSVDSSIIAADGSYISVTNNRILVNYFRESKSIAVGTNDLIYITALDSVTAETQVTCPLRVANTTNTNDLIATGLITGGSKNIAFTKPTAAGKFYITPNSISAYEEYADFTCRITNTGVPYNDIFKARIYFPSYVTNISSVKSTNIFNDLLFISIDYTSNYILIDYEGDNNKLDGRTSDTIAFRAIDSNNTAVTDTWDCIIDNDNGEGYKNTTVWDSYSKEVGYFIPEPSGSAYIEPNILFTDTLTNTLTYYIINKGIGNNSIKQAVINIPDGCLVTNTGYVLSSWINDDAANISKTVSSVTLKYQSDAIGPLTTGSTDIIILKVEDNYTSSTDTSWTSLMDNGSGYELTSTEAGEQKDVRYILRPFSDISPKQIESEIYTNQFQYLIKNYSDGEPIEYARIKIPAAYKVILSSISHSWGSPGSTTNSGYITIDYSSSPLVANADDTITFNAIDNISKASNTSDWISEINYDDGQGYMLSDYTNNGISVKINFTLANADAYFTPNQVLVDEAFINIIFKVENKGYGSNYIEKVRLTYPTSLFNVTSVTSSVIALDGPNINTGSPGEIFIFYDNESDLDAGITDNIYITFTNKSIGLTNQTILTCYIDNGDGNGYVRASTNVGSTLLRLVEGGYDAYISPDNIDTTTVTNSFTYNVRNTSIYNTDRVVISVPSYFTNITSVESALIGSDAANIRPFGGINITSFTMYYSAESKTIGLTGSQQDDTITFTAADNFNWGSTNLTWESYQRKTNDGNWVTNIDTGGQTSTVNMIMPDPDVDAWITPSEIYTTSITNTFVYHVTNKGDGSNDLFDVIINIPSCFTQIISVDSAKLAADPAGGTNISSITLSYNIEGKLLAGESDVITIVAVDNAIALDLSKQWPSKSKNSLSGSYVNTSIPGGMSQNTKIVVPPSVTITPNIILTTTASNVFTYTIDNSGAGGNGSVTNLKITIPSMFTQIDVITNTPSYVSSITKTASNIELTFEPLIFGAQEIFTIKAFDNWEWYNNDTAAVWSSLIKKNDGQGYKPAKVAGSVTVSITNPNVKAKANINPSDISTIDIDSVITNKIFNIGSDLNYIQMVKIIVPSIFTNITSVNSSILGASGQTITSNTIILNYASQGMSIAVGVTDNIAISVSDNVTSETSVTWISYAANTTNTNDYILTDILAPGTKELVLEKPSPSARSFITPNTIPVFDMTTAMVCRISNLGGVFNDIFRVRIDLPAFFTNITDLNSAHISNDATCAKFSNNSIYLDYASDYYYTLDDTESDDITFNALDNISSGTQVEIKIMIDNNNGQGYINSSLWSGQSRDILFLIPAPEGLSYIQPNIIFASASSNIFTYTIQNTGSGNNAISKAVIEIPTGITSLSSVSSYWTTNIIANITGITLNYSGGSKGSLTAGSNDTITLVAHDAYTKETEDYNWNAFIDNGSGLIPTSSSTNYSKLVNVVIKPKSYITPNLIESENSTNQFTYRIKNAGLNGAEIFRAKISIPSVYTVLPGSIYSSQISNAYISITNFGGSTNWIFIDYKSDPSGDMIKQETDLVTFYAVDSVAKNSNYSLWNSYVNYDDSYGYKQTDIKSGETNLVKVNFSPAKGNAYLTLNDYYFTTKTNTFVLIISNKGRESNYLRRAMIYYSTNIFNKNSLQVQSSFITNDVVNVFKAFNYIDVRYYDEGNLPVNTTDTLWITMEDYVNNVTASSMAVTVENGDGRGYVLATSTPGSRVINLGSPANTYITPNQVLSTIETNIRYEYRIKNGPVNSVDTLVMQFPSFFTNITAATSIYLQDSATYLSIGVTSITLKYSSDPNGALPKNANDKIIFQVKDSIITGYTSFAFTAEIDDGNGFVPVEVTPDQSQTVNWGMPNANAAAYIRPAGISTADISNNFTYYITNKGLGTDRIIKARINIPIGFTRVTNINSLYISDDTTYISNKGSYFELHYDLEGSYIPANSIETLTFMAYDNITVENSYTWTSSVYNYPANWQNCPDYSASKKRIIDVTVPGYAATAAIKPPNQLETTVSTNHVITAKIVNAGTTGNNIYRAEIFIPTGEFITNGIQVTSLIISNDAANITIFSDRIRLNYELDGSSLAPLQSDNITIKIFDSKANGWYNTTWTILCEFNTSSGQYIQTSLDTGDTKDVALIMPDAQASVNITPFGIYSVESNKTFTYKIINEGDGSNNIIEAKVYVPSLFTIDAVQSSHISNDAGFAVPSGGVITLDYKTDAGGPLVTGQTDTIAIDVSMSGLVATNNVDWPCIVTNESGLNYASTVPTSGMFRDVDIFEPTAKASADIRDAIDNDGKIFSTDLTNHYNLIIKNNGLTSDKLYYVKVYFPPEVTNVFNVQSSLIATNYITLISNFFEIDYLSAGTNIFSTLNDTITFSAQDNISFGSNLLYWDIKIDFLNGLGYINIDEAGPNSKNIDAIMPQPEAYGWLVSQSIDIAPTCTNAYVTYRIYNSGVGNNNILEAKIDFPDYILTCPDKITGVSSVKIASPLNISENDDVVYLRYGLDGNPIIPGDSDEIIIYFKHEISTNIQDIPFPSYVWNEMGAQSNTTTLLPPSHAEYPDDQTLDIAYPSDAIYGYIDEIKIDNKVTADLYTLDNNMELKYKIRNTHYDESIEYVEIPFDFNIFKGVQIDSKLNGTDFITQDAVSNRIIIYYTNGGATNFDSYNTTRLYFDGSKRNYDEITITSSYTMSISTNIYMIGKVRMDGDIDLTETYPEGGSSQLLRIIYSPWGKIIGQFKPAIKANVNLFYTGGNTTVTNRHLYFSEYGINKVDITVNDNGSFILNFIPPETAPYDFEAGKATEYFRTKIYASSLMIYSNKITNLGIIRLENEIVNDDNARTIYCYDDNMETKLVVGSEDIIDSFYIDMFILTNAAANPLYNSMINQANQNDRIDGQIVDKSNFRILKFSIKDDNENYVTGIKLGGEGYLTMKYDVAAQGWNEEKLGIFYWDSDLSKWITIGGERDTINDLLTANINYVHEYYGVMQVFEEIAPLYQLDIKPNPITPTAGSEGFNSARISFLTDKVYNDIEIIIYNMVGEIVKTYKGLKSDNENILIWWDGRDDNDEVVKSGVYIIKLTLDEEYRYFGSILVIK